jgi:hypothetical protein
VAKAVNRSWYRIALARPPGMADPGRPIDPSILVAAEGEHLGAAIAAAESYAKGSYAIACERAVENIPLGESVGKQHVVALPDDVSSIPTFRWPRGVLPRLDAHTVPKVGYVVHADPSLLVFEAMVEADKIADTFLGLLEKLPSADNLEIKVLEHFDGGSQTDVWLTSRVDGRRILSFLDDHDVELMENGHVELAIYIRAKKATLRLTEHKTVVWVSDGNELRADVTRWFSELSIPPLPAGEPLVTVAAGPHFHFRAAKSRDRTKLGEYLYRQRLRRVARVEGAAARPDTDG